MLVWLRALKPAPYRFYFAEGPRLKLEKFNFDDIKLMCELLKTKYFKFNEDVQIFRDVRLLDDKGKVLGLYTPVQARKKAEQLKKDLVLFNEDSTPVICKTMSFKEDIVTRFYKERVMKNKDEILIKRSKTKRIKLSPNMSNTDMKVKAMQILQLVKKQAQVEITMKAPKVEDEDRVIQKLESFKNMLGSSIRVLKNVSEKVEEEEQNDEQEEDFEEEEDEKETGRRANTYRFLFESSKDEYKKKVDTILKENPEEAIKKFLSRYIDQQDQQMRSLNYELEASEDLIGRDKGKQAAEADEDDKEDDRRAQKERRTALSQKREEQIRQRQQLALEEQRRVQQQLFKQYRFNQRVKLLLSI